MPYGNKPKSMGLKKLAQANPDKLKYVGPAKYAPKKMGCSGGGPNMYKMGSKEFNTPMNFSNKAMNYMKNMPAMYGKPKMDGDPVKKVIKETGDKDPAKIRKAVKNLSEERNMGSGVIATRGGAETTKQFGDRSKKAYNKKFGAGAAEKRKYDSDKAAAKKALGSRPTKEAVEAFKKKFPKMYGRKK